MHYVVLELLLRLPNKPQISNHPFPQKLFQFPASKDSTKADLAFYKRFREWELESRVYGLSVKGSEHRV